jgi:LacI family transcriptional regulator
VVIPDLMHSFFVEIVAGIESVVSERGYGLLLCCSAETAKKERAELEMLRSRQVDGVVIASANAVGNTKLLQEFQALGRGLVMIDRDDHPKVRCHRVLTDDVKVGRLATEHLLAAGRRAIAHIAGPPVIHAERRAQGYTAALRAYGVERKTAWIVPGGFMEDDGYQAMTRLLESTRTIDAVFAANDPAAIGAMKAIWDAGRSIPDDIAVVGAGNVVHSDLLRVPLTTVSWSKEEMGRRAAELILDQIGAHPAGPFKRIIVPPELIVRDSSIRTRTSTLAAMEKRPSARRA